MSSVLETPSGSRVSQAALGVGFLAALAPIVAVTMPPIMDFPNHLARIWLTVSGAREAPLDAIYAIDLSKAGANIGVDLAAAALMRAAPLVVVSKILVALTFLGPPLAGLILNRVVCGRWHPLQLALLSIVWSTTAIAGFVNFQIGLALALLGAAAFVKLSEKPYAAFALHLAAVTLLLFVHLIGAFFYAAAVAALEIGPDVSGLIAWKRHAWRLGGLSLALAAPFALIAHIFDAGARPMLPFWGDVANIYDPLHAATILLSPILSYDLIVDLVAAAPVLALIAFALGSRLARAHFGLTLAAACLFALSPFAPDAIGDGSWLPQRLPIMAALLFLAGLRPGAQVAPTWLPIAITLPTLARTFWIASVWIARQGDVDALVDTLRGIAPGSAVITLQQEPADWRTAPTGRFMIGAPNGVRATGRHLGALAVIERHAFSPTLFSVRGQHALVIAPKWRDIAVEASSIPYPRQLGTRLPGDPYLALWRTRFDYVLLLNADLPAASHFAPEALADLEPVAAQGFARLYRVIEPASAQTEKALAPLY